MNKLHLCQNKDCVMHTVLQFSIDRIEVCPFFVKLVDLVYFTTRVPDTSNMNATRTTRVQQE